MLETYEMLFVQFIIRILQNNFMSRIKYITFYWENDMFGLTIIYVCIHIYMYVYIYIYFFFLYILGVGID